MDLEEEWKEEGNGGEIEGSDGRDGEGDERDLEEEKEKKRGMVG